MKKILIIVMASFLVLSGLGAVGLSKENYLQKNITLEFSGITIDNKENFVEINLNGANSDLIRSNHYVVPTKIQNIHFPIGTKIIDVECTPDHIKSISLPNKLQVTPVPVLDTAIKSDSIEPTEPEAINKWFEYSTGCGLVNGERQIILKIVVYPVQYNPDIDTIKLAEEIKIKVFYEETVTLTKSYDETYDFIILAPSEFKDELNSLVTHKTNLGYSVKMVTLTEIYNGVYFPTQGRDNPEQIKYFIKNAIENWNTQYVLFVGGSDLFPTRKTHVFLDGDYQPDDDEEFHSELYFADIYDSSMDFSSWDSNNNDIFGEYHWGPQRLIDTVDLYPDVYLGRLACVDSDEVVSCINKIISYEDEQNPAYTRDWFTKIVVIGGDTIPKDETGIDEGEYVNQAILDVMQGFTPDKIWDSNKRLSGLAPSGVDNINSGINSGCGFVDWSGHGSAKLWTTYPHDGNMQTLPTPWGTYYNSQAEDLTNGDKLPIVVTGACSVGKFDKRADCFTWSFVANPNGGGVASLGPSALSWGSNGQWSTKHLGGKMQVCFFKAYAELGANTFGMMWTEGIRKYLDTASSMDCGDYKTLEAWEPFGDPTLAIAKESLPPLKPQKPAGPANGKAGEEYTYTTSTTDPEGNQVYYQFDWDSSGAHDYSIWYGPFDSGVGIEASHKWNLQGNFEIRVQAKDTNGKISEWSDPLPISMPRTKNYVNNQLLKLLQQYPILDKLLQRFFNL